LARLLAALHIFLKYYKSSVVDIVAMEREAKLRRLNNFRRALPHVTAAALAAILSAVVRDGVPGAHDRNQMRYARNLQLEQLTPYGPIIQKVELVLKSGGHSDMFIAHPLASLWSVVDTCSKFKDFFKERLVKHPPSPEKPWSLIIYSDEVTPGNPLATLNKRKFHAVYWSFLEFGVNALCREETWFCITTALSIDVNGVSAGLSQVFSAIIKTFFEPGGFDLGLAGISLPFEPDEVRFFAKLKIVLQDGGAHKSVWHARGDGASKLCLLCKNLFTDKSNLCAEDGSNLLRSNVIRSDQLVEASSSDLRKVARYLAAKAGTMTNDAFAELQQSLGVTHHDHALLLDRSLDDIVQPTEVFMHDWMHGLFVDGVANVMVYLMFESFIQNGMPLIYETFCDYAATWKWPLKFHGDHLAEIFETSRRDKHRAASHIKCQASDMLSLIGVLAVFTKKVLVRIGSCNAECAAFLAFVDVVDLITNTQRFTVSPHALRDAVHKFLSLFTETFGFEWLTPKFHWLLHFAKSLQVLGVLLNCFALERKHRIAKRYATEIENTSRNASKSILMEVVSHQFAMLDRPGAFMFEVGLVGGRPASKKLRLAIADALGLEDGDEVRTARESRFNALGTCIQHDVVLVKDGDSFRAGQVQLHFDVNGVPISIIDVWELHRYTDADVGFATWKKVGESRDFFGTEDIIDVMAYQPLAGDMVGVILPVEYR
jgi:hypothetical protein